MGRKKRKHKHKHPKRNQTQTNRESTIMQEEQSDEEAESSQQTTGNPANSQHPPWWRRPSITDYCISAFTFVLAGASIFQFSVMQGQLDEMRRQGRSDRAWINIEIPRDFPPSQGIFELPVTIVNNGKTPARSVNGPIRVEVLTGEEEPQFTYNGKNAMFVNAPLMITGVPSTHAVRGLAPNGPKNFTITENTYIAIYGRVEYADIYGIKHWLQFCHAGVTDEFNHPSGVTKCLAYNDIDQNF